MSDLDVNADDPFDVLGIPLRTPLHEIKERAQALIEEHDSDEAIQAIEAAFTAITDGPHLKQVDDTTSEPLLVSVDASAVELRKTVKIAVSNIEGKPVENAEVRVDDVIQGQTDDTGKARVQFQQTGNAELTVTKPHPDDGFEYRAGTATVTVEKQQRALAFTACPDTTTVGEAIDVQITDITDERTISGVTIRAPQTVSDETDGDGWTTLQLSTVGSDIELTASKSGSSNQAYQDAMTTIDVAEREVDLAFADPPDVVTFDDPETLRVVEESDNGVRGVTVAAGAETATTDDKGRALLRFDEVSPDSVTVSATKQDRGGEQFLGCETVVTVAENEVVLSLSLVDDALLVGEPSTFEVTDANGEPVEGAYVSGTDGDSGQTDVDGQVDISFEASGETTVSASKVDSREGYAYKSATLDVTVERETETLVFTSLPNRVDVNETVAVSVATADVSSGACGSLSESDASPVSGASISAEHGTNATTGTDGRAYISFGAGGQRTLTAEKSDTEQVTYEAASTTVVVAREERSLALETVSDEVLVGEYVDVRVTADGTPVEDATVLLSSEDAVTTGTNGWVRFTPTEAGSIELTATKADTNIETYATVTETVSVVEPAGRLAFADPPETVPVGEAVTFRVVDGEGTSVRDATVTAGEHSATTDADGYATLSFESVHSEPVTATATKCDTSGRRYVDTSVDFSVTENRVSLSVELVSTAAVVGETLVLRVTDGDSRPVAEAIVGGIDAGSDRTDEDGRATLTFEASGRQSVSASKSDDRPGYVYEDTTDSVTVEPRTRVLTFELAPSSATVGETVEIVVSVDDDPVDNATVTPEIGLAAKTDGEGRAFVQFAKAGTQQLTASKEQTDNVAYEDADTMVDVEPDVRSLELTVPTSPIVAGRTAKIQVTDGEESVAGASIEPAAGTEATTDAEGYAFVQFFETGEQPVSVSKSTNEIRTTYRSCETTVAVVDERNCDDHNSDEDNQ